jgi:hypothetical protein
MIHPMTFKRLRAGVICEVTPLAPDMLRGAGPVGEPCPPPDRLAATHDGTTRDPPHVTRRGASPPVPGVATVSDATTAPPSN